MSGFASRSTDMLDLLSSRRLRLGCSVPSRSDRVAHNARRLEGQQLVSRGLVECQFGSSGSPSSGGLEQVEHNSVVLSRRAP